jgi:hypothetical protein
MKFVVVVTCQMHGSQLQNENGIFLTPNVLHYFQVNMQSNLDDKLGVILFSILN